VLLKGKIGTVPSRTTGKDVRKCELVVSDRTAVIGATIWEDVTETVTEGQVKIFGYVRVGYFNTGQYNVCPARSVLNYFTTQ